MWPILLPYLISKIGTSLYILLVPTRLCTSLEKWVWRMVVEAPMPIYQTSPQRRSIVHSCPQLTLTPTTGNPAYCFEDLEIFASMIYPLDQWRRILVPFTIDRMGKFPIQAVTYVESHKIWKGSPRISYRVLIDQPSASLEERHRNCDCSQNWILIHGLCDSSLCMSSWSIESPPHLFRVICMVCRRQRPNLQLREAIDCITRMPRSTANPTWNPQVIAWTLSQYWCLSRCSSRVLLRMTVLNSCSPVALNYNTIQRNPLARAV